MFLCSILPLSFVNIIQIKSIPLLSNALASSNILFDPLCSCNLVADTSVKNSLFSTVSGL